MAREEPVVANHVKPRWRDEGTQQEVTGVEDQEIVEQALSGARNGWFKVNRQAITERGLRAWGSAEIEIVARICGRPARLQGLED